jgi:hypothetical membrane protein
VTPSRRRASHGGGAAPRISAFPWRVGQVDVRLIDARRTRLRTLAAIGGVAGPALFTGAWVISSLRQPGHSPAEVQLSGLAAVDAADPQIMIAGFVALGTLSAGLGAALVRLTRPQPAGAWLVVIGGAATVAAGIFRRDHMLLTSAGFAGESWHHQLHDLVSGMAYGAMVTAPLVLARRFRRQPAMAAVVRPVVVLWVLSAATLAVFASRAVEPWNGLVQRASVTLALSAEVVVAVRAARVLAAGS